MTWWGVVNPGAGSRDDALDRVHQVLAWRKVNAELNATEDGTHLLELVRKGVEEGFTKFLAVGGDGTVNLIVNALLESEWDSPPTVGVLPSGTGCDLIRSFGISQDLEEAASHLVGAESAPLDAVRLSGPWGERFFVNSAGSGLTAGVVEEVDRLPPWMGAFRYQIGIWPALVKHPHAQVEVACGEQRFEGDALMIVLSNARFLGGGMKMAPHADPADGKINLQVFHGPKWLALKLKPMVQRGKHLDHPNVTLMTGTDFSIRTDPEWPIETDGEFISRGSIEGSVLRHAVQLKV